MAEAKCTSSISRMEFLSSTLPTAISCAKEEILSGVLRNSRGTKVYVSLLDTVLVVGRCVSRPSIGKVIQVSWICPTKSLVAGCNNNIWTLISKFGWGKGDISLSCCVYRDHILINCPGYTLLNIDWLTCVGIPWPYPNQLPGVHGSKWWRSC